MRTFEFYNHDEDIEKISNIIKEIYHQPIIVPYKKTSLTDNGFIYFKNDISFIREEPFLLTEKTRSNQLVYKQYGNKRELILDEYLSPVVQIEFSRKVDSYYISGRIQSNSEDFLFKDLCIQLVKNIKKHFIYMNYSDLEDGKVWISKKMNKNSLLRVGNEIFKIQ